MDERPKSPVETLGQERSVDRLEEPTVGSRHVIASFVDVEKARAAARQLSQIDDGSRLRLMIRRRGPVTEGESPEEVADMDIRRLKGMASKAGKGALIGSVLGVAVVVTLWLTGIVGTLLSFALAVPICAVFGVWVFGIISGYYKTWDMSYRDAAMDGQAVVMVDTNDGAAAKTAFGVLLGADAQVVEEFDRGERLRLETGSGPDPRDAQRADRTSREHS
jgi:hypothetical protein